MQTNRSQISFQRRACGPCLLPVGVCTEFHLPYMLDQCISSFTRTNDLVSKNAKRWLQEQVDLVRAKLAYRIKSPGKRHDVREALEGDAMNSESERENQKNHYNMKLYPGRLRRD